MKIDDTNPGRLNPSSFERRFARYLRNGATPEGYRRLHDEENERSMKNDTDEGWMTRAFGNMFKKIFAKYLRNGGKDEGDERSMENDTDELKEWHLQWWDEDAKRWRTDMRRDDKDEFARVVGWMLTFSGYNELLWGAKWRIAEYDLIEAAPVWSIADESSKLKDIKRRFAEYTERT